MVSSFFIAPIPSVKGRAGKWRGPGKPGRRPFKEALPLTHCGSQAAQEADPGISPSGEAGPGLPPGEGGVWGNAPQKRTNRQQEFPPNWRIRVMFPNLNRGCHENAQTDHLYEPH